MSEGKDNELERFLSGVFDTIAAQMPEKEQRGHSPEAMARFMVNFVSSPHFWTDRVKQRLTERVTPYVQRWFDGQLKE